MSFRALISRLTTAIEATIFAGLFGALIYQVVARFVFDRPAAWSEEIAAMLFLWTIFWGAAFTTPLSAHVAIELVDARFGPRTRRVAEAVGLLLVGGCFAWALPGIVDYIGFMDREKTPVTGLPLSWVYAIFAAFAAAVVWRCAAAILRPPSPTDLP